MDSAKELLQKFLSDGILSEEDIATKILEMNTAKIKKIHPYAISQRKDGRYITKVLSDGKKKQINGKTENELYKKLYEFYFPKTSFTLTEVYEKWMLYRRDNTSAKQKSLLEAKNEWNKFFAGTSLASTPVEQIKPVQVLRFFREKTKDRQYTQKRISNARSVLNGIMSYAIEEELITHNPVSEINFKQFPYKTVDNRDDVFSVEDAVTLLTYLENIIEPYALAIRLDFNLLIRIGELKALQWNDVDFINNTIYIHQQALTERQMDDNLNFHKRSTVITNQMKGYTSYGYRKQPLTPEARHILELARNLNPKGMYIFMPDNRIMTTDSFNRRLKKYCHESGITYHSSHKIRFYTASSAYNGDNLITVSRLMGHSNVETTMHYLRDTLKGDDVANTIGRLGLANSMQKLQDIKNVKQNSYL